MIQSSIFGGVPSPFVSLSLSILLFLGDQFIIHVTSEDAAFCTNNRQFAGTDRGCVDGQAFCAGPNGEDIPVGDTGSACFVCEDNSARVTEARGCPPETPICGTTLGIERRTHHNVCYVCVNDRIDDDGVTDIGCEADANKPFCRAANGSPLFIGEGGMGCFSLLGAVTSPSTEPSSSPVVEPSSSPVEEPSSSPLVEPSSSPVIEPSSSPLEEPPSSPLGALSSAKPTTLPDAVVTLVDSDFEPPTRTDGFVFVTNMFVDGDKEYTQGFYNRNKGKPDPISAVSTAGLIVWLGGSDFKVAIDMSAGWRKSFAISSSSLRSVTVMFDYQIIWPYRYDDGDESRILCGIDNDIFDVAFYNNSSPIGRSDWITTTIDVGTLDVGEHTIDLGGINYFKNHKRKRTYIYLDNILVTGVIG